MRNVDRLEKWAEGNLMEISKSKCKVLYLGWNHPMQPYSLGADCAGGSSAKKVPSVLLDNKLNMSWQCVLAAKEANSIPGCGSKSVASRAREMILPSIWHLRDHIWSTTSSFWAPRCKKDIYILD